MVAKRVYLHIGLPKTGTSALQRWFHDERLALEAAGISYPEPTTDQERKHGFLVSTLRIGKLDTLERVLLSSTCDTVILSNEGLSNHFDDFDVDALARFRRLTAEMRVEILCTLRDKESWLRSYYRQCVVNPNNGASDLWGTSLTLEQIRSHPRILRLLDTDTLLRDIATGFGASGVHRFAYGSDWFGHMTRTLGLEHMRGAPLERLNESMPDWAIELLRTANEAEPDNEIRLCWRSALADFLGVDRGGRIQDSEARLHAAPSTSVILCRARHAFGATDPNANLALREFTKHLRWS